MEVLRTVASAEDGLEVLSEAGTVDILVVAFGPYAVGRVAGAPLDEIRRMSELNYLVPAAMIASVLPSMLAGGYGRILVFGSTFGDRFLGFRESALYAAPKAALASFVRSVARTAGGTNVRCNMLCPGYVTTEYHGADDRRRYAERSPGNAPLEPEDLAGLAAWLVSEENRAVSGAIIPADNGL